MFRRPEENIEFGTQARARMNLDVSTLGTEYARWIEERLREIFRDHWLCWPYIIRVMAGFIYRLRRRKSRRGKYKNVARYVTDCYNEDPDGVTQMTINGQVEITIFSPLTPQDYAKVDVCEFQYGKHPCILFFTPEFRNGSLYIKLYNWQED